MSTGPYQAALATLRRCQQGLVSAASSDEREALLQLHEQALALLEQSAATRHVSTAALAAQVARLEKQMANYSPAERAQAIQERLGISRSYYFAIRKNAQSRKSRTG